jgi:hypothetical protein
MREEAILAKKKQEVINQAMEIADAKGRNVQQMIEGRKSIGANPTNPSLQQQQ